jgi:hypothetical protein
MASISDKHHDSSTPVTMHSYTTWESWGRVFRSHFGLDRQSFRPRNFEGRAMLSPCPYTVCCTSGRMAHAEDGLDLVLLPGCANVGFIRAWRFASSDALVPIWHKPIPVCYCWSCSSTGAPGSNLMAWEIEASFKVSDICPLRRVAG